MSGRGTNGRGRGRGHSGQGQGPPNAWARGPQQQQASQQQQRQQGPQPQQRQQAPQQQQRQQAPQQQQPSAWGPRGQSQPNPFSNPQTSAWPTVGGQASHSQGEPVRSVAPVPTRSEAAVHVARSGAGEPSVRGSLNRRGDENIRTKPDTVTSKTGNNGNKITVQANFFQMVTKPQFSLNQYRVDFEPDEERTHVKVGILKECAKALEPFTFDGGAMFSTRRIENTVLNSKKRTRNGDEPVQIKIRFTNVLNVSDPQYIHFFNIVMRKCIAALNLQLVGHDYYDAVAKTAIPAYNFDVWPGFTTSIRQHEYHILMNVDMTHKIMRNETAFDFLMECKKRAAATRSDYRALFGDLLGQTVITLYNNQTYRIDDISYDQTILSTFPMKGQEVTYKKYYEDKYQITLRYNDQPLLVTRPKAKDVRGGRTQPVLLIPELCNLTGLSESMRSNQQLMRALADHTRVRPDVRMDKYLNFLNRITSNQTSMKELRTWDLEFSPNLVTLQARVLPKEDILFGKNQFGKADDRSEWNLRKQCQFRDVPIQRWAIIALERMDRDCSSFIRTLQNASKTLSYFIPDPLKCLIRDDRVPSYNAALDDVLRQAPQIVVIILPNNRGDRYAAIKRRCCIDRPVASQVVLAKNLDGKNTMSIATKIAIQMNCKLGGAPWTLAIPFKVPTMIAGYDVCHDTINKGKSFGALVATLDKHYSKYYSNVMAHSSGEELSNFLAQQMCAAVCAFRETNGRLPERIFFYRDGVGEGNLSYVYTHELENMKTLLKQIYGTQDLKITVVIVSKRISTRLFHNRNNPPPGTVVDDTITLPEKYDFFLISQYVKQGTVTPTSYNVISDGNMVTPTILQTMTYKLCHMYYNWSGTIRVPAPCQYAHKLAFLAGQHLHAAPNQQMSDLLFFL